MLCNLWVDTVGGLNIFVCSRSTYTHNKSKNCRVCPCTVFARLYNGVVGPRAKYPLRVLCGFSSPLCTPCVLRLCVVLMWVTTKAPLELRLFDVFGTIVCERCPFATCSWGACLRAKSNILFFHMSLSRNGLPWPQPFCENAFLEPPGSDLCEVYGSKVNGFDL